MPFIRPRLTEYYGLDLAQASVDFAIPFLSEDLPLYVDPFLLWKSPSLQDQSLHGAMIVAFNRLGWLAQRRDADAARLLIIRLSECEEVGLGSSANRRGKRIGASIADKILSLFGNIPSYTKMGFAHFEEIQLYVEGISKDRISDVACSLIKSFLIDYTIEQSEKLGIPKSKTRLSEVYNHQKHQLESLENIDLPLNPINGEPILFVPKRWLRFAPWIEFEDYFKNYIPKDDQHNKVTWDRVSLLNFNRDNYGVVREYVTLKELTCSPTCPRS